jgi:hypothetical protein
VKKLLAFLMGLLVGGGALWVVHDRQLLSGLFGELDDKPRELQASTDLHEIELGEKLLYTALLRDRDGGLIGSLRLPNAGAFEMEPRSGGSFSYTNPDGISHRYETVQYVLTLKKIGTVTLGPAALDIEGKTLLSNPVVVRVFPKKATRP